MRAQIFLRTMCLPMAAASDNFNHLCFSANITKFKTLIVRQEKAKNNNNKVKCH